MNDKYISTKKNTSKRTKSCILCFIPNLIRQFFCFIFRRSSNGNMSLEGEVEVSNTYVTIVKVNNQNVSIEKKKSMYVLQGDKVLVQIFKERNKYGEKCGKIVKILRRYNIYFFGTIKKDDKGFILNITDRKIFYPIFLTKHKSHDIENKRAKVKILQYPSEKYQFFLCEIVELYGNVGDHDAEMNTIIAEYDLKNNFNDFLLKKVEQLQINIEKELKDRRDYRDIFTLTIDPDTAKDFDDALSIKKLDNGNFEIGVHIADVSFFVQEKSIIDQEAYKRNTSVYLIDRVIPMLPERLCNDLCSLRPNEEKLTMSIIFEFNDKGQILNEWIGETVIKSNIRMTYDEAKKYLDDKESIYNEVLTNLYNISKILREERMQSGAINFEFEDLNFSLDDDNNIVINKTECTESHHLVEEFMLLANRRVAEFVANIKNKNDKTPIFLYRTHESPEKSKIFDFMKQMKTFGIEISNDIDNFNINLNKLIEDIKDKPEKNVMLTLAVRTMQKAAYTTKILGHYGLGFKHYTHFTSPIRRYVDICVHRLLKQYLKGDYIYDNLSYEKICQYANEREVIATDAERESIKFKQVSMLETHIGEKCIGTVSGLAEYGIFVELNDYKCDGLVRFADYKDDYFIFDRVNSYVFGKYTGNVYRVGDQISVVIKKCDIEKRLVDLTFY